MQRLRKLWRQTTRTKTKTKTKKQRQRQRQIQRQRQRRRYKYVPTCAIFLKRREFKDIKTNTFKDLQGPSRTFKDLKGP